MENALCIMEVLTNNILNLGRNNAHVWKGARFWQLNNNANIVEPNESQ